MATDLQLQKKSFPAPRKIESVLPRVCGQMLKRKKSRPTSPPQNNTTLKFFQRLILDNQSLQAKSRGLYVYTVTINISNSWWICSQLESKSWTGFVQARTKLIMDVALMPWSNTEKTPDPALLWRNKRSSLYKCFNLSEKYKTCLEVILGNKWGSLLLYFIQSYPGLFTKHWNPFTL